MRVLKRSTAEAGLVLVEALLDLRHGCDVRLALNPGFKHGTPSVCHRCFSGKCSDTAGLLVCVEGHVAFSTPQGTPDGMLISLPSTGAGYKQRRGHILNAHSRGPNLLVLACINCLQITSALFQVLTTDTLARMLWSGPKLLLVACSPYISGSKLSPAAATRAQGRLLSMAEHTFMLYRTIVPAHIW